MLYSPEGTETYVATSAITETRTVSRPNGVTDEYRLAMCRAVWANPNFTLLQKAMQTVYWLNCDDGGILEMSITDYCDHLSMKRKQTVREKLVHSPPPPPLQQEHQENPRTRLRVRRRHSNSDSREGSLVPRLRPWNHEELRRQLGVSQTWCKRGCIQRKTQGCCIMNPTQLIIIFFGVVLFDFYLVKAVREICLSILEASA